MSFSSCLYSCRQSSSSQFLFQDWFTNVVEPFPPPPSPPQSFTRSLSRLLRTGRGLTATLMTSFFNLPLLIEVQSWLSPFLLSVSSERCVDHRTQRHCRQVTRGVGAGGHGSATGHKNTGATWEVKSSSEAVVWFHKLTHFSVKAWTCLNWYIIQVLSQQKHVLRCFCNN